MSWNFYRKILNVLLQNLMRMEHFQICILKLLKKLISRKLMERLNWNFVCSLFSKSYIHSIKIMKVWQRDRNCMDSCWVSTVDVTESPIASGARGLWQQQWCDSLHCHEEWWDSVPQSVVVLDKCGATGTCSSRQCLPSSLQIQCGAVLPHQCHMPQWTSPSQHIV